MNLPEHLKNESPSIERPSHDELHPQSVRLSSYSGEQSSLQAKVEQPLIQQMLILYFSTFITLCLGVLTQGGWVFYGCLALVLLFAITRQARFTGFWIYSHLDSLTQSLLIGGVLLGIGALVKTQLMASKMATAFFAVAFLLTTYQVIKGLYALNARQPVK